MLFVIVFLNFFFPHNFTKSGLANKKARTQLREAVELIDESLRRNQEEAASRLESTIPEAHSDSFSDRSGLMRQTSCETLMTGMLPRSRGRSHASSISTSLGIPGEKSSAAFGRRWVSGRWGQDELAESMAAMLSGLEENAEDREEVEEVHTFRESQKVQESYQTEENQEKEEKEEREEREGKEQTEQIWRKYM